MWNVKKVEQERLIWHITPSDRLNMKNKELKLTLCVPAFEKLRIFTLGQRERERDL